MLIRRKEITSTSQSVRDIQTAMKRIEEQPDKYLATATAMLTADGMSEAAAILRTSIASVAETGYDNWDGGTRIWTITLAINAVEYAKLSTQKGALEEQISNRLIPITKQFTDDWLNVEIVPTISRLPEWRDQRGGVSTATRRNIIDGLRLNNVKWHGRIDEVEFLERIYELKTIPSSDRRYETAADDIWQHRSNNDDWRDDWIYDDSRFDLIGGPADIFLRFLCEMVHPVVRSNRNEALKLVSEFNDQLRREGWHLVEEEKIGGRPRFVAKPAQLTDSRSVSRARTVADALDASWMQKEIERLENAVESDPALAIGTAKELVESCCKSILKKSGVPYPKNADLPKLTKTVTKALKLVPEGISDEAKGANTIKLILRNLSALTQYLGELRGLYGSGHGRDGKHRGLEPRHARLAVGAAVAFIDFATSTYRKQIETES